jgi:biotin carboxyl carrier protein
MEVLGEVQAVDDLKGGKGALKLKMKKFKISVNGNWHEIEIKDLDESPISVLVDGELYAVEFATELPDTEAVETVREEPEVLVSESALEPSKPAVAEGEVIAPMPGKILAIDVGVGDRVKFKDVLCTLEAMKMENEIMAPGEGVVREVRVTEGQDVLYGDVLFVME